MDFLYSLYDALISINVPNNKARAVVDAMERDMATHLATKTDVALLRRDTESGFLALRKDMETLGAGLRQDMQAHVALYGITIRAELPGVKKEDVKITLEGGVIRISGERKDERKDKGTRFHRIESFHGVFSRSFTLPENVDAKAIKAASEDGVLMVHLPKTTVEAAKPVEIKVK